MNDPDHSVLHQPWRWAIEGFVWHAEKGLPPSVLDVWFVREDERCVLRFIEPQDVVIRIDGIHPAPCGDMAILDISQRQLDGLHVQVTEFGASGTPLRLYARSVERIDS